MKDDDPAAALLRDSDLLQRARESARGVSRLLRLPFRNRVWKGAAGEFQGGGTGSSIDFQDHRTYLPGDDPRHINWQAYARTGNYSMKLYREEVRPQVDLILDVSRSMFVDETKAARSLELFFFCVDAAGQTGAGGAVNIWLVCGDQVAFVPDMARQSDAWTEQAIALWKTSPAVPPELANIQLRANALRVMISDTLFPESPERIVSSLAARNGCGVILAPFTAAEEDPAWQGNYEFVDVEDCSRHVRRVEPALLKRYRVAYENHIAQWKSSCTRHAVAFARVAAESLLEQALQVEGLTQRAVEPAV
ncbi:MAG: hypothetical protein ACI9R3_000081 [Verrucomicrobiales bacterium]|jgi:uncharacterized protein (DUF58 family)